MRESNTTEAEHETLKAFIRLIHSYGPGMREHAFNVLAPVIMSGDNPTYVAPAYRTYLDLARQAGWRFRADPDEKDLWYFFGLPS